MKPLTSSITPSSLKSWPDKSIAIVAHDAGSARLLFSWLTGLEEKVRFYVEGPAKRILIGNTDNNIIIDRSLEECIRNSDIVITGTGWTSDLEHKARVYAYEKNKTSIAVLDHWVNYRERFERNGKMLLPDGLWVADKEALDIARNCFKEQWVEQLDNKWLNKLSDKYFDLTEKKKKVAKNSEDLVLLYLLEPIRSRLTGEPNSEEFCALDYWLEVLSIKSEKIKQVQYKSKIKLRLRMHPTEPEGKYNKWIIENLNNWNIELDPYEDLAESLANADMAFGCETQALVAAIECHVPAFCTLPPGAGECRLPHKGLQKLTKLNLG